MRLPFVILLDLILLFFFFGGEITDVLTPKKKRPRRNFRGLVKNFRNLIHRNRDLLSQHQTAACANLLSDCATRLAAPEEVTDDDLKKFSAKIAAMTAPLSIPSKWPTARSWLETLVVSAGVAFAIRSLLLSPFSIPTGSMQPTLFGIHYVALEEKSTPALPRRVFDYLNYSRRYAHFTAPEDGRLDYETLSPAGALPLFPNTTVTYRPDRSAALPWKFPASLVDTQKTILELYGKTLEEAARDNFPAYMAGIRPQLRFAKDTPVFQGAMEAGDHLFVNRLSLAFSPPNRGQVMVFDTTGLRYNGEPLTGQFYIKRLVGMPGDTLKILDRALWVKPAGETEFHKLDGKDAPGFTKINSQQNGYAGYANISAAKYLRYPGEEYVVPPEHYFMLGDNTENSLDSRFWGPVPRKNLIGRPCFIWWPFSDRWGFAE